MQSSKKKERDIWYELPEILFTPAIIKKKKTIFVPRCVQNLYTFYLQIKVYAKSL